MSLDSGEWIAARVSGTKPRGGWDQCAAGSLESSKAWQEQLRTILAIVIGGLSAFEQVPLNPRTLETRQMDGYRREWVQFTTRTGLEAVGYFLLPDNASTPLPAILCLPGHGRGVDSIVGIAEDGSQRPLGEPAEYAADYALQCVAHGYAVFALEQLSFGHRRDEKARRSGPGASSCTRDSTAALMLDENIIGWRVWDSMKALDYLVSRPEVNAEQLGIMGISGGGLTALFTAGLDLRIRSSVVSGYLNTFAASVLSIDHCVDNYAPGLFALCEMSDIAGLIAPRALYAENGKRDPIFPVAAFEEASQKVAEIYTAFGVPEAFSPHTFDGEHEFNGTETWEFLDRYLR